MKTYENVRILRVIACLGVFAVHLAHQMRLEGIASRIASFGAGGVYLFFVISGFLGFAAGEFESGVTLRSALGYYVKRAFRILPLYYAVVIYNLILHTFLLKDVPTDPSGLYWLRYFFLTNGVIPAPNNFWGNLSSVWTISVFAGFYLLFPLFYKLVKSLKAAFLLYGVLLAVRFFLSALGLDAYFMIFYYMHYFALGMIVWFGWKQRQEKKTGILLAGAGLLFFAAGRLHPFWQDTFLLTGIVFALLVLFTCKIRIKGKMAGKLFKTLDTYSYDIYLVHAVVLEGIEMLGYHIPLNAAVIFLLAVILTGVGSFLAGRMIEKPAAKWGRRLAEKIQCADGK